MLKRVGVEFRLVSTPEGLDGMTKVLLPGVGAFDNAMERLAASGLIPPLRKLVLEGRVPLLGICLGMQLLGKGSAEGVADGLGFIDARCERLRVAEGSRLRVPHMGWNLISPARQSPLLAGLDGQSRFYFAHSYHLACESPADVLATTGYGEEFVSMVQCGNIMGAQFHPEKGHRFGMTLLKNFAAI